MKIFDKIVFRYVEINNTIEDWLKKTYNKSSVLFNSSSPFGQILTVIKEIYYMNVLNIKNILSQLDIENTNDSKVIRTLARISGHNQSRPISASGVLNFKTKANADISKVTDIILKNGTVLKNKSNSLTYSLNIGSDDVYYNVNKDTSFFLNIVQGKFKTQNFTGTGEINQSLSIEIDNNEHIEHFNIEVYYNGVKLDNVKHFFDMSRGDKSCFVRTGFNGGVDVYFGNNYYGFVPEEGSLISVRYLLTDGSSGNITTNKINDWYFIDTVFNKGGDIIDVEELFNISIQGDINFSSDGESIEYTKKIIPYVSRNYILATKSQFIYHLKKLNMFSKINVYSKEITKNNNTDVNITDSLKKLTDSINKNDNKTTVLNYVENVKTSIHDYKYQKDNTIYIDLIPKLNLYINKYTNYFNVPLEAFKINNSMKTKVLNYLKSDGIINMTSDIEIISPDINKFVSYIYIRKFKGYLEEEIKSKIITLVSDFFINYDRFDRIVRSDVIELIKGVEGVDAVDVYFVSEENEKFHTNNPNSTELKGIDPVMGDILMKDGELTVMRGEWRDRNGIYYHSGTDSKSSMNSLNIIFNGVTEIKQ